MVYYTNCGSIDGIDKLREGRVTHYWDFSDGSVNCILRFRGFFLEDGNAVSLEWVIEKRRQGEDSYLYDLNPYNRNMWLNKNQKNDCYMRFVFTKTLLFLYGTALTIALVLILAAIMPV